MLSANLGGTLFFLLAAHAVADYPLQGDFLAKAKNHTAPIPGIPWIHGLLWHSLIHGGFVGLITGSALLGCAETLIHMRIDYAKCDGKISFNTDQALHVGCKVGWVALMFVKSLYETNGFGAIGH